MKSYRLRDQILIVILILLVSAGWIWHSRLPVMNQNTPGAALPQEGFFAPGFQLKTIDGKDLSLADLRGAPVILNFWASWCPPCRAEMPAFQRVFEDYSSNDLTIVAINSTFQDSLTEVSGFVNDNSLTFPILLDTTGSVSKSYNLHSLPTTFFINSQGLIQKIIIGGPIPKALIRIQAENLLQDDLNVPND
ncbi:MAG: TlpA disulfide reductase family protein [Anaerolineales bacterium]